MSIDTAVPEKVFCPVCGARIFDVARRGSGLVEMKCVKCRSVIRTDLSTLESVRCRLAKLRWL